MTTTKIISGAIPKDPIGKCPRCGGAVEPYGGAMSRVSTSLDVDVEICSACGFDESLKDPLGARGFEGWHTIPKTLTLLPKD